MVGPNKQFDREEVLSLALHVFWDKGYEATSMQDLVTSMGINRASMYQTYGNKYKLFNSSIDLYIKNTLQDTTQILGSSDSPLDALQELFQLFIESSFSGGKHGCFINNTAIELASHDSEIAEKIQYFWNSFEDIFSAQINRAIKNKQLASDIDSKQISSLLNVNLQGLMVKSKTNTSKEVLFSAIDSLFDLIRKKVA